MNFRCITPCLNAETYLLHTSQSIIEQSILKYKEHTLHYTIIDGGSTDNTLSIIQELIQKFNNISNITIDFISEPDTGIYHALSKGFTQKTSSHVFSYLNAGDYYSPNAFEIVADIFKNNEVHFLTGLNILYNEKNHIIDSYLPFSYNSDLISKGAYGSKLPFLQQESTFWSQKAQQFLELDKLKEYKYAGDYYMWKIFSKQFKLYNVNAWLGGFKIHKNQISTLHQKQYQEELNSISNPGTLWSYLITIIYRFLEYLPNSFKIKMSNTTFSYNHQSEKYTL